MYQFDSSHGLGETMRTTSTVLLTYMSLVAFCALAATFPMGPSGDVKSAVEHVLRSQQDAWNHHDLDAFMTGYWNSADLTFFSGAKQTGGLQATLDRYGAAYARPRHEMGRLGFSDLPIESLG